MNADIERQATRARAALDDLAGSNVGALSTFVQALDTIDADQHPAALANSLIEAIHTLATDHGMRAVCSPKYEYIRTDISGQGPAYEALNELAALVELVTDKELQP